MQNSAMSAALSYFRDNSRNHLEDLKNLVQIPSISFPGFDHQPIRKCAQAVADLMQKAGLQKADIIDTGIGNPSVFGSWQGAQDRPTILMYAHYDVQPIGRENLWVTPPFEPSERNGRLYGRGVSDDKGGVLMLIAAVASYLKSSGRLPVNVKLLIEGEEEVGSTNLENLLSSRKELFSADAVIIADSENFDTGHPSLTASLRGIVTVTVEVKALSASVHSGTWGGPLPDPVIALSKMLATLVDNDGKPAIPGLLDKVRTPSPRLQASMDSLPFCETTYRKQARLLDGVELIGGRGSVYEKMWYRPSIAVNAFEASSKKQAANIINDSAWARVGVRIVPDMDPNETLDLLRSHLLKQAPWGVKVDIRPETPAHWWCTDAEGAIFDAATAALERGYNRKPSIVGAGGTIPFVRTITETLGGVPALLLGVGDPYAAAHSENENLVIADWESACRSIIHLFAMFP